MAIAETPVPSLISIDEQGRPRIQGTRFKVIHIARDIRNGMSVDEIHEAYADLSLAQIYAALSYYHAHKGEMDVQMERDDREEEAFLKTHSNPVSRQELLQRLKRSA
jgi:uncharacterized protein (DUF433 family)